MYSSQGGFAKVLGQRLNVKVKDTYIVCLSQFGRSVSELAELFKTASASFHEMFAKLSLVFLLKCVELSLITVKVVIVALLGQMTENFGWRVVEVAGSTVLITFIVSSFALLGRITGRLGLLLNGKIHAFGLNW